MQVTDRHTGNGILGQDKDGNWVGIPIDLAWAGRAGQFDIERYAAGHYNDYSMVRDMKVGKVKVVLDMLPESLRAEGKDRVRTVIELSRDRIVKYNNNRDQHIEDVVNNLKSSGASDEEVAIAKKQLEKIFNNITRILDEHSLEKMYQHFGVN